jgi:hypothetical protein
VHFFIPDKKLRDSFNIREKKLKSERFGKGKVKLTSSTRRLSQRGQSPLAVREKILRLQVQIALKYPNLLHYLASFFFNPLGKLQEE